MVMLDEQPVHAEGGGLLPNEGAPEEHEGGGALRPEEVDNGPVIPEGWILDFRTRRLVPFVLPDDPDAANLPPAPPPGWEDEEDEDEEGLDGGAEEPTGPTESFVQRAQRAMREVMTMPPGWQAPACWTWPDSASPRRPRRASRRTPRARYPCATRTVMAVVVTAIDKGVHHR